MFLAELKAQKSKLAKTTTVVKHLYTRMPDMKIKRDDGKKRTVLVIGRHFAFELNKWIGPFPQKILLTDTRVKTKLESGDLKHDFSVIVGVDDYDLSPLVDYEAMKLHKEHRFTHVVAITETDLIRAARYREAFGLFDSDKNSAAQTVNSALRFRDKITMKDTLKDTAEINLPIYAAAETALDILRFREEHKDETIVVKPRSGHSSIGAAVLRSEQDVIDYLSKHRCENDCNLNLDVELFCEGEMYHIDGFVERGVVRLVWPSKYVNTCVDHGDSNFLASLSLHPSNPLVNRLQEFTARTVVALDNVASYAFHAEVWVTKDDDLILCEVASRAGGAYVIDQIRQLFDVNLHRTFVEAQCELELSEITDTSPSYSSWVPVVSSCVGWLFIYPPCDAAKGEEHRYVVQSIPEDCTQDGVLLYEPKIKKGQVFVGAKSCVDAVAAFLIESDNNDESSGYTTIDQIYNWFIDHFQYTSIAY